MVKTAKRRTGGARRPRTQDQETEARILEAARAVFLRRGTSGARMQEIAREAGVNQALLHYYFRNKQTLSTAVFRQSASRIFPALIQTLSSDLALEDKIERILRIYIENLAQQPFLPGYLISEMHHHPERVHEMLTSLTGAAPAAVMQPLLARLQQQIDERVAAGAMRPVASSQLIANLISLAVFPFAARPMMSLILGLDDAGFAAFIETRRRELPALVLGGLRP